MKIIIVFCCIIFLISCTIGRDNSRNLPEKNEAHFSADTISDELNEKTIDNINENDSSANTVTLDNISENDGSTSTVTRDLCSFILNTFYKWDYNDMHNDPHSWVEKYKIIRESLLTLFGTRGSFSIDLSKELPFIESSESEDGTLRIYNWEVYTGGTFHMVESIIQYGIDREYSPMAWFMNNDEKFQFPEYGYGVIKKLKNNLYLIGGGTTVSSFRDTRLYSIIQTSDSFSVRENELLSLYPAFNNENFLNIIFSPDYERERIYSVFFSSKNGQDKIIVVYDVREDINNYNKWFNENPEPAIIIVKPHIFDIIEFIFNGVEFIGDYEKLNELK